MASFASRIIRFCRALKPPDLAESGVQVMNPFAGTEARRCTTAFYRKFFSDTSPRLYLIGINPGRFGGGTTGIPFTDPVSLAGQAGIANTLPKRRELSAEFIERVITRLGGPRRFYRSFFITAVSPLGFTRDGLNCNYYDDAALLERLRPFIVTTFRQQLEFGARRDVAIVLGTGRNHRVFEELNAEHGFFSRLIPLEHPRYIMQYRRRALASYVAKYERVLRDARRE